MIDTSRLSEQVYEQLREDILYGDLPPGTRLNVKDLAERFGVSPTPVRQALVLLEADSLTESVPRRGTFVAKVSRADIREVFQSRRIIECAASEQLATNGDEVATRLTAIVAEMERLRDGATYRPYSAYIKLDTEFHDLIVDTLGNDRIAEFFSRLRWSAQVIRGLAMSQYQRALEGIEEHRAIAEAILTEDPARARAAVAQHLDNAEADLVRHLPDGST
jgi:DNA-binding GntR family transcriptional regulator